MYHCPGCGGQLRFDIASEKMLCDQCGTGYSVSEAEKLNAATAENEMEGYTYTCPNCGGEMFTMDTTATTFCSFCGSSVLLESRLTREARPDRIIPFRITKEKCIAKYNEYIRSMFCVDHRLMENAVLDSFRAIYVPYCNYKTETHGMLIGEVSKTRGDKEYIYNVTGQADYTNNWQLKDLSLAFPDDHSERINEFNYQKSVPFSPAYLAGFYADLPDIKPGVYREEVLNGNAMDVAKAFYEANGERGNAAQLQKVAEQAKRNTEVTGEEFVLLPVWFMSFRHKDRICYAMVNGVTGNVTADLPVDFRHFFTYAGIASAGFFFLLAFVLNLVMKPAVTLAVASVVLCVIAWLVRKQYKRMILRETETERLKTANESVLKGEKVEKKLKIKGATLASSLSAVMLILFYGAYTMLQHGLPQLPSIAGNDVLKVIGFIAMAATGGATLIAVPRKSKAAILAFLLTVGAFLLLVLNPPQDLMIYAYSFVMLLCGIYCEYDMIRSYNAQCSNAIPVFDTHKGGEDRA